MATVNAGERWLPAPKRGTPPDEFYLEYVPRLWAALVGGRELAIPEHVVAVELVGGAKTLTFGLRFAGAELRVTAGQPESRLVTFVSDLASWKIAAFDLLPRMLRKLEARLGDSARAADLIGAHAHRVAPESLRGAPGTIELDYVDDAGDEASVRVLVANGAGPRVRLHVTDTELWRLVDSGMRLSQLLRTRLQLDGDVAYLLELGRLLDPG